MAEFDNFIGVWEEAMPLHVCQKFINHFEKLLHDTTQSERFVKSENQYGGMHRRRDVALFINHGDVEMTKECNKYLKQCFENYLEQYPHLKDTPLLSTDVKMHRTEKQGGYHIWHCENAGFSSSQRVLVWIIYLNDVEEGQGETEFLYQKKRVAPKAGRCVIWPAAFTHLHRGNPVTTGSKYILTGWFLNRPGIE